MMFKTRFKNQFLNAIARRYGAGNARALKQQFFDAVGMPLPGGHIGSDRNQDWLDSCDSGVMVFLETPAVILRIRKKDAFMPNAANILQPLATRPIKTANPFRKNIMLEVMPGVKTHPEDYLILKADENLEADGYNYWDIGDRNTGILPTGEPVVIDIGAVRDLNQSVTTIKDRLIKAGLYSQKKDTSPKNPQDDIYGDLKDSFNRAWPQNSKRPKDMTIFWRACLKAKQEGRLIPGWTEHRNYGQHYAKRWQPAL